MQVFSLPRHLTRTAQSASRLLGAKPPNSEAQRRRDAVARWRGARANGLTAEQAARAVGIGRATLYRWMQAPIQQSRRPHRCRTPSFTPALVQAVEELRADNPMWGKRKLAVLLRREGAAVSTSTVGRILRKLMDKGVVTPVPTLRRNPDARRIRLNTRQRYARRLPKGLKPSSPGEIVQIDTLFVNVRPDRAIKHFTAYDPVAKWTVGLHRQASDPKLLGRLSPSSGNSPARRSSGLASPSLCAAPWPDSGRDGSRESIASFIASPMTASSSASVGTTTEA